MRVYAGLEIMQAARYLLASPAFKLQAWPAYASGGRENKYRAA
jgi:hypothetical protein